jgi:uncharacterized protein YnzC (UPF0291/DUF896 family)
MHRDLKLTERLRKRKELFRKHFLRGFKLSLKAHF